METAYAIATAELEPPEHAGPLAPVITGLLVRDREQRLGADGAERMLRDIAAAPDTATVDRSSLDGSRREARHDAFCQTDTCFRLSLLNGSRFHPAQRSRSVIPASRAIRSSSAGQTARKGTDRRPQRPSSSVK